MVSTMSSFRSGNKKTTAKTLRSTGLNDWHLWNEVKLTIRPLAGKSRPSAALRPPGKPFASSAESGFSRSRDGDSQKSFFASRPPATMSGPSAAVPALSVDLPDIEPGMHRRLRRGRVPIDASIDLHGMNRDVARVALFRFIRDQARTGSRTLLVITGKGHGNSTSQNGLQRGVLRQMLPLWLQDPALAPLIAGFEVSARHHGGEGAFYVRLKKRLCGHHPKLQP